MKSGAKRVTRDIDLEQAWDLLERAPRACISFASESGPQNLPVGFRWHEGRYLVSLKEDGGLLPAPGQEVVLLVDEGLYYFQLRAVYIRGLAQSVEAPPGSPPGRVWIEIVPTKTVAWDYGSMREVNDERG